MANKIELTLEYLIDNYSGDVYSGIQYTESKYPPYIERPSKPILSNKPTSDEAFEYATKLKEYEGLVEIYNEEIKIRQEKINKINDIIVDFIKSNFSCFPEKYLDDVYSEAWYRYRHAGFYAVYQELCENL
jgi:hypothetical protein